MKKMVIKKRLFSAILAAVMVTSLVSCGNASTEKTAASTAEAVNETKTDTSFAASEGSAEIETASEAEDKAKNENDKPAAGDVIVDLDFSSGTEGFDDYTNGGEMSLGGSKGELVATIKKTGTLDYANQAFWDGFKLVQGVRYTYSFDIHSDIDRTVEYRIQMNGGDYHAYKGEKIKVGSDVQHVSTDFEMTEVSDPAPRIVFNMGLEEGMDENTPEHKVYIDNIKLVVKDSSNASETDALAVPPVVTTNQVGYNVNSDKMVFTTDTSEKTFEVINADTDKSVYSGKFGKAVKDQGTEAEVKSGSFTDMKDEGTYYIKSGKGVCTYKFKIGSGALDDIMKSAVLMLYKQRCGTATDKTAAGDFAHPACHTGSAVIYGTNEKKDVTGGWHDAGDYGRYVVSGAKTVQDLMLSYENYNIKDDNYGIPESKNGIPDILDEARYELEWMMKMQDEKTGGVYHKVTCRNFPETVMPEDETDELIISPVSAAATGDFAAVMAKASRIYANYDKDFSGETLAAAEKAWDYLKDGKNTGGFTNPDGIVTGEYPDTKTDDEIFWAASEMMLSENTDPQIEKYVKQGLGLGKNGEDDKVTCSYGWASVGGYGISDIANYSGKNVKSDVKKYQAVAKKLLTDDADSIIKVADQSAYHISFAGLYTWGSNMEIADDGKELMQAYIATGDEKYKTLAADQLNYILGSNPLGYCFVTGFGTVSPKNPHHRPSQVKGKAMDGMLAGGADSLLEDPYAKAVLKDQAPALCYADNAESYSTNEVTIYWNSALIYLLAAYTQA